MTEIELYNNIRTICPIKEAQDIIDHCNNYEYNQARFILDSLQDDEIYNLSQVMDLDNTHEFDAVLEKLRKYQKLWNEMVHRLELQAYD